MNKGKLTAPFRKIGLMHTLDKIKFYYQKLLNQKKNRAFVQSESSFVLPPDYMLFESFQLDYQKYKESGWDTADEVVKAVSKFKNLENNHFLDWGCGPARVVRHLSDLLPVSCQIFGTDYNLETIDWCKTHIQDVQFEENNLSPPLVFRDDSMDVIYGLSVFTHLSAEKHLEWIEEMGRISRPGAIWYFTTQGAAFLEKMTNEEQALFKNGSLVVRGNVVEGHRVFSTFQPISYMEHLFSHCGKIVEHIPGRVKSWGIEQDVWIVMV